MIKRYKNNSVFRHFFWMTLTYIATHWFLLVASGRWWDDWGYADKNWDYLYEVMRQSSLPLSAYVDASTWFFPDGFYRVLVFGWYYIATAIFYMILQKIDFFREEACFWITLLFVTVPVFDARILWILYPYAIGMPLFFWGVYLTICNENIRSKKGIVKRIISLVILMLSYCFLQTVMLFAIPLILYLCYLELKDDWNWKEVKVNTKKIVYTGVHYLDYWLEPVVWYFGDKLLFPGYGVYGGVYDIKWSNLSSVIINSPKNVMITLKGLLISYYNISKSSHIVFVAVMIIYVAMIIIRVTPRNDVYNPPNFFMNSSLMTILGFVLFFLAFFPYAVKENHAIVNTYINGRYSILLGIGTSILLYYGLFAIFRHDIVKPILISLIVLGIMHFNYIYMDWQECYYQQVQLQHEFSENEDVKKNNTFLVMSKGALISTCFYQMNGNSWAAFGNQKRLFMEGVNDISCLISRSEWLLNAYMMNEYNYEEQAIDGIIFVDYMDIGRRTLVKQKYNEIFHKSEFDLWIDEIKNMKYVSLTREESDRLLKMYLSGRLNDEIIYELYYRH